VEQIRQVVKGLEAGGREQVRAVVVHRDADGPDRRGKVEAALYGQLAPVDGKPVVPVQMIEAWWFPFPDAVEAIRPKAWGGCPQGRSASFQRFTEMSLAL
jgi:hypothetical protein